MATWSVLSPLLPPLCSACLLTSLLLRFLFVQVSQMIPVFADVLSKGTNEEATLDALWGSWERSLKMPLCLWMVLLTIFSSRVRQLCPTSWTLTPSTL